MNELIGNTPIIKIKYMYKDKIDYIYTKLEYYNLTGSIKDRVIYYILDKAYKEGKLKKGMPLVEATSGNTGISLSAIGRYLGHDVYIFMPDWVSKERVNIMKIYGAKVILISKEDGGFKKCIELARDFSIKNNAFLTNQFENKDNLEAHYLTTGKEIVESLDNVSAFISGIGTGGTLMGVAKRLREKNKDVKIFAIEPENMSLIKNNKVGSHKIEGIGDDFIPDIVDLDVIDDVITVTDEEALSMAKKIANNLGIGVGISSGANLIGAIKLKELGFKDVVTVFPDDLKKYLSTDLSKTTDSIHDIKLLSYEIVK